MAKKRIDKDAYYTPAGAIRSILPILRGEYGVSEADTVLEPSCGGGNIIHEVVRGLGIDGDRVTGVDVSDRGFAGIHALHTGVYLCEADFLTWEFGEMAEPFGLCIGNPPYGDDLPEKFIRRIMAERMAYVTAFLLRLNWLGSQKRSELHRELMPDVYVLSDRPSFTGGGSDGCEYAWFVWTLPGRTYPGRPGPAPRKYGSIRVLPPYVEQVGLFG